MIFFSLFVLLSASLSHAQKKAKEISDQIGLLFLLNVAHIRYTLHMGYSLTVVVDGFCWMNKKKMRIVLITTARCCHFHFLFYIQKKLNNSKLTTRSSIRRQIEAGWFFCTIFPTLFSNINLYILLLITSFGHKRLSLSFFFILLFQCHMWQLLNCPSSHIWFATSWSINFP